MADQPLSREHLELLLEDMDRHGATIVIELGADTTEAWAETLGIAPQSS